MLRFSTLTLCRACSLARRKWERSQAGELGWRREETGNFKLGNPLAGEGGDQGASVDGLYTSQQLYVPGAFCLPACPFVCLPLCSSASLARSLVLPVGCARARARWLCVSHGRWCTSGSFKGARMVASTPSREPGTLSARYTLYSMYSAAYRDGRV